MWRLIAKALGEKSGKDNKEADKIALLRLLFVVLNIVTCLVIIGCNFYQCK